MKLAQFQQEFRHWLVTAEGTLEKRLDAHSEAGLAIYQNNYRSQLITCLKVSYPLVLTWLGEEVFIQLAIAHIDSRPPHAWTLDAYGADFGETLRTMLPHNPDVHELAWIEWSLSESFVAPDAGVIANDELLKIDWDIASLQLSPSLRQHAASTNAHAIWSALQDGAEVLEGEMLDAPGGLLVWRREFTSRVRFIDAVEHAALLSMRDDGRFTALCDALVEQLGEDEGVARAGALLADWLAAGIVVGVDAND